MSRIAVWSNPRSGNKVSAVSRIRPRVFSALRVERVILAVGSMAMRSVYLLQLGRQLAVRQILQPDRKAMPVRGYDFKCLPREGTERRARQPLRQPPVPFQRVQTNQPGMIAQINPSLVADRHQLFRQFVRV